MRRSDKDIEPATSALRLELRPGGWALWDTRPHTTELLIADRVRMRELVIRDLLGSDGTTGGRSLSGAENLGVTPRTMRRPVARCAISSRITSLIPRLPGPHKLRHRPGMTKIKCLSVDSL
jgi:hypothetical protein